MPAIVLLSGGLDSTTCLAIARAEGFSPIYTMAFDYGQRHRQELIGAREISRTYDAVEHRVVTIDLRQFGQSALTADWVVPKDRPASELSTSIPTTYVPARNTIFLSYALAWAEVLNVGDVFLGVNALDYSGYPDCRPDFIEAFAKLANLATRAGREAPGDWFRIHTPLLHWTKSQIIQKGNALGIDYGLTHSCYDPSPDGLACGRCDSCQLRRRGFIEARVTDPTGYA